MTTFLVFNIILQVLACGMTLSTKPGAPRKPEPSAGGLLFIFAVHAAIAAWAVSLLLEGVAA